MKDVSPRTNPSLSIAGLHQIVPHAQSAPGVPRTPSHSHNRPGGHPTPHVPHIPRTCHLRDIDEEAACPCPCHPYHPYLPCPWLGSAGAVERRNRDPLLLFRDRSVWLRLSRYVWGDQIRKQKKSEDRLIEV